MLDSKKARDAFYESLKVIETKQPSQKTTLNAKLNLINTSSSSISSRNQSTGGTLQSSRSTSSDHLNSMRILNSSRSKHLEANEPVRHVAKPYDNKNNFSNLIKIDTRFKSDSFENNLVTVNRNQFVELNQLKSTINNNDNKINGELNQRGSNLEEEQLKEKQQKLLQQSQNRLKNLQDLINKQKSKHRETITNLLQRRQNLIQTSKQNTIVVSSKPPIDQGNRSDSTSSPEENKLDQKAESLLNQGKILFKNNYFKIILDIFLKTLFNLILSFKFLTILRSIFKKFKGKIQLSMIYMSIFKIFKLIQLRSIL